MVQKTVLVTGASRGIGFGFAQFYINAGWNVIAAVRNRDTADKLKALKPYMLIQLDPSNEDSILTAAKQLEGEPIDLLINNAGMGIPDTLADFQKEVLIKTFELNALGPLLVSRALLPNLRLAVAKNGSATIGQVSSMAGSVALTVGDGGKIFGYRASKAALNIMNMSLAHDLKEENIVTIVFCPGRVLTDLNPAGVLTIEESVASVAKILDGVTVAETGSFFNYDGDKLPW